MRVFILEDEIPAMGRMKELIRVSPHAIEICGEAQLGTEAIQMIDRLKPDLLFLDIQLPDISGFEVLKKLEISPYVIFTSAYAEHALKAFEYHSIDYLVKPITQERFDAAIDKYDRLKPVPATEALAKLHELIEANRKSQITTLPIKDRDRIKLISFDDIAYFEAEDKYVTVALADGNKFLLSRSLAQLEIELPNHFHRVHRSFIVNQEFVVELERHFKGRFLLKLNDRGRTKIRSGEMYRQRVKNVFGF